MRYLLIAGLVITNLLPSCKTQVTQEPVNSAARYQSDVNVNTENRTAEDVLSVDELCKRLIEMRIIPFEKDRITGDPIYDGLMSRGQAAMPCLIDKITSTEPMKDPREAPHVLDFTAGDAAVFMLHRITDVPITSALSEQAAKNWKTEGVFAYFEYVQNYKNRKEIKKWWMKWEHSIGK